ncbi:MAG: hypothetical protein DRI95_12770 [Bacteroidetes bacterium]|nr:MAG: hypothetical protein DRI95_12770 [Bacteroidota bacterium]
MVMDTRKNKGYWFLITFSSILLLFLIVGQSYSLIDYNYIVSIGLQESSEEVTKVGIAWLKAFAIGDTLAYIPLLLLGIIGMIKKRKWGYFSMFASLAISVYWPIVNLSAIYLAKNDINLNADKYVSFSIILPILSIYGLWGMFYLYKNRLELKQ